MGPTAHLQDVSALTAELKLYCYLYYNNNLFKPPKRRKFLTDCTHTNFYIKLYLYEYES